MKTQRKAKSVLMAFYQGGTKFKAALDMTVEEVEKEVGVAKMNNRPAKLTTVDEDPSVQDGFLYFTPASALFYNILVPLEASGLVLAPANALPNNGR